MPAPEFRLAVIADVHGNAQALRAVLAHLRGRGYDQLIVNGDVVNRGPDSVAAMQTLLATDALFTLGNHDDLMRLWAGRSPELPAEWFADPFWAATDWSVRQLERAGLLPVFADWPMTRRLELPGAPRVLIAHGTPDHYRESLGARTPEARLHALLDSGGAEVLVGSHIHVPFRREAGGRLWLNTGAVGTPFGGDPRAQYLTLDLRGGRWEPQLHLVPYDVQAALGAFERSGLSREGGLSAHIFREELRLARSLYTPFWDYAEKLAEPKTEALWEAFQLAHPERFEALTSRAP